MWQSLKKKRSCYGQALDATKAVQSVHASSWWHFDGAVHEGGVPACCLPELVQVGGDNVNIVQNVAR